jgi:hypothetical protein
MRIDALASKELRWSRPHANGASMLVCQRSILQRTGSGDGEIPRVRPQAGTDVTSLATGVSSQPIRDPPPTAPRVPNRLDRRRPQARNQERDVCRFPRAGLAYPMLWGKRRNLVKSRHELALGGHPCIQKLRRSRWNSGDLVGLRIRAASRREENPVRLAGPRS